MFNIFGVDCMRCCFLAGMLLALASGAASACVDEKAIVDLDIPEGASSYPCNNMVFMYARSLGVKTKPNLLMDSEDVSKYPYFFPARDFIRNLRPEFVTKPVEQVGRLAAILALTDQTPPERRAAYRIFANYNLLQLDALSTARLGLFFVRGVQGVSTHPALDTRKKNVCFVKADMPTLTVAEIVESEVYRECLSETK